ncbi:DegV family protein [Lachnospiraceae bacterium KM106-2]|nr:DegV family protein [Lachnospiraceae bacterium KM106-2]
MIKIITDSTCDISLADQNKLGIEIIPMDLYFGEDHYKDGLTITHEEFYQRLNTVTELPTTSQINPNQFEEIFQEHIENGHDVIAILLSSELSGTYQSAMIAANMIESDHLFVIDSLNATMGLSLLVHEAIRLHNEGLSAKEITAQLEEKKSKVRLYAYVDTLKFLKMGGRLSAASAAIGGLLGINPIIEIAEGKVNAIGKERGRKKTYRTISNFVLEHPIDENSIIIFGHTSGSDYLNEFKEIIAPAVTGHELLTQSIGCVVGTHIGPGAVGISYFEK